MRRIDAVLGDPVSGRIFQPIRDPEHGTVHVTGVPFQSSTSPIAEPFPSPALGEHGRAVLAEWLGLGDDEVTRLEASGALV